MNKLDQAVDVYLRTIEASCPRLLFALHESPEAVRGEIMRMESACHVFEKACAGRQDKPVAAREIMTLVQALRVQMAKGLNDYEELAGFRQGVSAIQRCANRLRNSISGDALGSNHRLKIYVFYCTNNLDAGRLAGLGEAVGAATVATIGLPCSGKVDVPYLLKAFETGADAVAIVACQKNECRHFEGSARAHKRAAAVESLLEEIDMGAGRMAVFECGKDGAGQVLGELRQFIDRLRNLDVTNKPESVVA